MSDLYVPPRHERTTDAQRKWAILITAGVMAAIVIITVMNKYL